MSATTKAKCIESRAHDAISALIMAGANVREMFIESEAFGEIERVTYINATGSLFAALTELQSIVDLSRDVARDEVSR